MAKQKVYVVWVGHEPGIYLSWTETQRQVKNYPGAKFKSFESKEEAAKAYEAGFDQYLVPKKGTSKPKLHKTDFVKNALAVDAACKNNPGPLEYRGVHVASGELWFHEKFSYGTQNIGEFLAIVHGLAALEKRQSNIILYTDSRTAMNWISKTKTKTTLKRTKKTEELFKVMIRAERWLHERVLKNRIVKWDTERWGEIPADFGRK